MSPKALILAAALASSTAIVPVLADTATNAPAATAPAVPGQQQQRPVPLHEKILFNLLDRNGDGAIDQDEFNAFAKAVFASLDTSGDGKITLDEFAKAIPFGGGGGPGWAMRGQFMHHGPGGPGGPGFGPRFDHFGMDGHHGPRPDWRQGQNDQGPGGPQPAQFGEDENAQPPAGGPPDFASLDKNGDGVISQDEFQAAQAQLPPPPAPQQ